MLATDLAAFEPADELEDDAHSESESSSSIAVADKRGALQLTNNQHRNEFKATEKPQKKQETQQLNLAYVVLAK